MSLFNPTYAFIAVGMAIWVAAILWPSKPVPRGREQYPPPTWPDYLGETDLPHVPVARVQDAPAIWGGEVDVVTGEVIEPAPRRQIGAGR